MERVAVFLDYENVHRTGHQLYAVNGENLYDTVLNPVLVAERLIAIRKKPSELVAVNVFRGKPVPAHQPIPASASDRQARKWSVDPRVHLTLRDLKYEFDENKNWSSAREKGIDVALAIGLVAGAMNHEFDVAIVFSSDTDLLPAIELTYTSTDAWLEIACWASARPLWFRDGLARTPPQRIPYCHFLNNEDFARCRDEV